MMTGSVHDPARVLHRLPWRREDLADDRRAVTFIDGPSYTRGELRTAVEERERILREGGIRAGGRVCLLLDNGRDFVLDLLALSAIGAVTVPLNTALRGRAFVQTLEIMGPCLVRVERAYQELVESCADELAETAAFWFVDEPGSGTEAEAITEPRPEDLALIMLTSGTTSLPKGVMWSHQMAITFAEQTTWVMGYDQNDVIFTCLPLFHINALLCALYPALLTGAEVVIAPRFSASQFWTQIVDSHATTVNMMGAIPAVMWSRATEPIERSHSIRLGMVLPLPADRVEFESRFGFQTTETYGSTDTGLPLGIPFGQRRPGSCGLPTPGWQVALVDEYDEPVTSGELGELVTRPTAPYIGQLGYWRQPELTLEAMRNQWFHTGDLLTQDAEGWFTYHGRRKDMVRVSGENVSTLAVEATLLEHPAVLEAAVFGVPSELGEDAIAVAIVLREGHTVEPVELRAFAAGNLPYFAVPRFIGFLAELPKTSTQKVMKATLQDTGVASVYWDGGRPRRTP